MPKSVPGTLAKLTLAEANAYLRMTQGDELAAAVRLAHDRNFIAGSSVAPDATEVHHALFLLRRARGLTPPSYDEMRVKLRKVA